MKRTVLHIISSLALIIVGWLLVPAQVYAQEQEADATARLSGFEELLVDRRVAHVRSFLEFYNSPLADDAVVFVREADKNDIDWRLVVAIAGTESTFGKHVPRDSYNAWGWGIPTGAQSGVTFASWRDGIAVVSEGLRRRYIERGANSLEAIGAIYAASPVWASHVRFFLDKIDTFVPADPDSLDITI